MKLERKQNNGKKLFKKRVLSLYVRSNTNEIFTYFFILLMEIFYPINLEGIGNYPRNCIIRFGVTGFNLLTSAPKLLAQRTINLILMAINLVISHFSSKKVSDSLMFVRFFLKYPWNHDLVFY